MATAVPIDPAKLIEAARGFANHHEGQGRPRPVWLRRATSSAYYALFHSIVLTASEQLLPANQHRDRLLLARSFSHQAIATVCGWIASGAGAPEHSAPLVKSLRGTPVEDVATAFGSLRLQRHEADYDHLAPISKATALAAIDDAERGMVKLAEASDRDRETFVALLCLKTTMR